MDRSGSGRQLPSSCDGKPRRDRVRWGHLSRPTDRLAIRLTREGRQSTLNRLEGRQTTITRRAGHIDSKGTLVRGTLDMLILRTLERGRAHGHDIARHIHQTTGDVLRLEHGSLYPALHRLERRGLVSATWELHRERKREFRYYRLTAAGRRQLSVEASRWQMLVDAIARVMRPDQPQGT
jgi:PadR family transcriptional regulator, regulatory protein PadR